ncbi:MAG: hypothetical protein WDW38_000757 [Sanguina aurantia]
MLVGEGGDMLVMNLPPWLRWPECRCGVIDWSMIHGICQPHATMVAGLLFGVGWWVWADSVVYGTSVLNERFNPVTLLPGIVATFAIIIMNLIGRDDVSSETYNDDAALCRSRTFLFMTYLASLGAIGGSVAILLAAKQREEHLWVGASGVIQCVSILGSGMLTWFFHSAEQSNYGYSYM